MTFISKALDVPAATVAPAKSADGPVDHRDSSNTGNMFDPGPNLTTFQLPALPSGIPGAMAVLADLIDSKSYSEMLPAVTTLSQRLYQAEVRYVCLLAIDALHQFVEAPSASNQHAEAQAAVLTHIIVGFGESSSRQVIERILGNAAADLSLQRSAAEALVRFGGDRAAPAMRDILKSHPNPLVKMVAAEELGLLRDLADAPLLRAICQDTSADPSLRAACAKALFRMKAPQHQDVLWEVLLNSDVGHEDTHALISALFEEDRCDMPADAITLAVKILRTPSSSIPKKSGVLHFLADFLTPWDRDLSGLSELLSEIPPPSGTADKLEWAAMEVRSRGPLSHAEGEADWFLEVYNRTTSHLLRERALDAYFRIAGASGLDHAESVACGEPQLVSVAEKALAVKHLRYHSDPRLKTLPVLDREWHDDRLTLEIGAALTSLEDPRGIALLKMFLNATSLHLSDAVIELLRVQKMDAEAALLLFKAGEEHDIQERFLNMSRVVSVLSSVRVRSAYLDGLASAAEQLAESDPTRAQLLADYRSALAACPSLCIANPFRFDAASLIEIVKNRSTNGSPDQRVAVLFGARSDYNYALLSLCEGVMNLRSQGFRVEYFEIGDRNELEGARNDLVERCGKYCSHVTILSGHGIRTETSLGEPDPRLAGRIESEATLSLKDEAWLKEIGFGEITAPEGSQILISCSTGQGEAEDDNMVNMLHRVSPHAELCIGPRVPTPFFGFDFQKNNLVLPIFLCSSYISRRHTPAHIP